jgi:dCMP deaminase
MFIGLTGENCSGKGTVADYLGKKSFYYYSLSDVIRYELQSAGMEVTRDNLIAMGNQLREKLGTGALAEKIIAKLEPDKNYIIDSIRNPAEIEVLRRKKGFTLVAVRATHENRFKRMKERNREGDPCTLEEFSALEAAEASNANAAKQQILACLDLADKEIRNDGDLDSLNASVDGLLADLMANFKRERPSWDEYFLNIAKVVASRSNCMKRKVAALIVQDKRIISTGYNGTPRGVPNCDEGGCPRCNSFAESGSNLEECLCSHGEENAIVQAAYHGIRIQGATLYCTLSPCLICTKMIINAGLKEVVYNKDYPLSGTSKRLFEKAGVVLRQYHIPL